MNDLEHLIRGKHQKYNHNHDSLHLDHGRGYRKGHMGETLLTSLAGYVVRNKAISIPILLVVLIAGIIIALLCVLAFIKLIPMAFSLVGNVEQIGFSGIVDTALKILRTIWEGGGKG